MYRGYLVVIQHDIDNIVSAGKKAIAMVVMAITLWLLDIFACDFFLYRFHFVPHFHAMWHVLTATAFHEIALIQIFLFLKKAKQSPRFVTCNLIEIGVECQIKAISM